MKTKEELNALKGEVETLNRKLRELTEEELAQVTGGSDPYVSDLYDVYKLASEAAKKLKEEQKRLREGELP